MADDSSISRRSILKAGAAAAVGAGIAAPARAVTGQSGERAAARAGSSDRPRSIIFMVSDGMSLGVPTMAEHFSRLLGHDETHWVQLARAAPTVRGFFETHSLNSMVTDSAAASSAWGSGQRVNNWAINTLPDGRALTPIAQLMKDAGKSVGLVTTTRITHATPAGFAAAAPDRGLEDDIAIQYLGAVDVLLGGGAKHFDATQRKDQRDLAHEFIGAGYALCRTGAELGAFDGSRVLGLFDDDHLPYSIDRAADRARQQRVPALADMTRAALAALTRAPRGFLLQIEGGRVDHAAHNNDAAAMLHDQLAFDEAIGVARTFCRDHPETLVVITTDHGTGNPGMNGLGTHYAKSDPGFARVAAARASFEAMHARLLRAQADNGGAVAVAHVIAILQAGAGITIGEPDANVIASMYAKQPVPELSRLQNDIPGIVGQILGNHTGISFTSVHHTADWAPLLAFGPGAEAFNGLMHHTAAFERMTALMNLTPGNKEN